MAGTVKPGNLWALYNEYRSRRDRSEPLRDAVHRLYLRYVRQHEEALLDAAAAAAGLGGVLALIAEGRRLKPEELSPELLEAFHLQYPNLSIGDLADCTPDQLAGIVNGWKGKYFEVLVRDRLNAGQWVGPIHLAPGQYVDLADTPTQPGWDLVIHNADGSVADTLQLKATESLSYIKEALERYPDIQVLTTDEVFQSADPLADPTLAHHVFDSGISDADLTQTVQEAAARLTDHGDLVDALDSALPGVPLLPAAVILATEGYHVLTGRKTLEAAIASGKSRFLKSGVAMLVGGVAHVLGLGVAAIPITALTRLGMERYALTGRVEHHLDTRMTDLVPVAEALRDGGPAGSMR
ncbi:hypothetical protein [Alicyclobacillus sp.]|uniref:hypothetical protein n=1 Tax=Alicyclobacillus sp. TaxID=61169 RepID=UPI0025BE4FCE|nr:hypothetical protein [Alicyclobacillus sp.]MCL6516752.1 hypothetical protein [Alicyclobacillus sp.]